ncbi:MAG: ribosome biogenesis GTPase Der [Firmicutes bacterium]|nr:ribosome biogenesis GTPase Der [Bacillota bacterium]
MNNVVAIVGRPNVGKSTLFNRLTIARTAIEEKMPGVTRDRLYGVAEWSGRELVIIDTGGVTFGNEDRISVLVRHQVELAVDEANLIIFLLDGREGLTALDEEIGLMLRRSGKPVIPVINKIDIFEQESGKFGFYSLGFGEPLTISAAHGKGSGELLDLILSVLSPVTKKVDEGYKPETVKVAVIGRPNVGKSSLINKILGEDRVIVSEIPGTTRDAIDTYFEYAEQPYLFIDTAGIRRKSKVKEAVEYYSILRSLKAVQRADLALLMLDGVEGATEQDQRLAGYVDEAGRGLILVVNKWDLARGTEHARAEYIDLIKRQFSFVPYAHQVFLSALTGWKLNQLFPLILQTWQEQHKRISTSLLNELLEDAMAVNPPPNVKGKRVKLFYMTQPEVKPPTFVVFANEPDLVHFSYLRYLENRLRESFDFKGTPVIIKLKKRQRRGD